jgi:hypothetical protein
VVDVHVEKALYYISSDKQANFLLSIPNGGEMKVDSTGVTGHHFELTTELSGRAKFYVPQGVE